MNRLFSFLDKIKEKPGCYLGNTGNLSVERLSFSIAGFEAAVFELTGDQLYFNFQFQLFISQALGHEGNRNMHWSKIIEDSDAADPFALFFEYLAEFRRVTEDGRKRLIYRTGDGPKPLKK